MKYIKLFENFSSEHPFSITVFPTEKYKRYLQEVKNSEGKPSFLQLGEFSLSREKGGRFNLVKIATTPFESGLQEFDGKRFNGRVDHHWLSYDPENSEIYVRTSRIFGKDIFKDVNDIWSTDRRFVTDDYRENGLLWTGGFYLKFPKGFEVGMEDEKGYFKITKVESYKY